MQHIAYADLVRNLLENTSGLQGKNYSRHNNISDVAWIARQHQIYSTLQRLHMNT